jgi:hypothetical protein
MLEWEFKGEVTPEELRKRFAEYEDDPGRLKSMVIDYLMPYMVREMLRTKADAMTKAEAIYYFGDIAGLFFSLHGFYNHITRAMELMESDALEKAKKDILSALQEDAKKVIELYAELRQGRPLDIIRHELSIVATGLRVYVYKTISYLEESTNDFVIRWIMTKGFD